MLHPPLIQAKLAISHPGDKYEQEADRIAEQVMHMPEGDVLQSKCTKCDEDEKGVLQVKESSGQVPMVYTQNTPSIVHEATQSPGYPLDTEIRAFMEPRLGYDFSKVRVHTNMKAIESAQAINALAYTIGNNIVFGEGQYAPYNGGGRKLLVHELTHVIQQSGQRNSIQKKNGSQKEPMKDEELINLKLLNERWEKLTKGMGLEERIDFLILTYFNRPSFAHSDTGQYNALPLFFLEKEDFFIKELTSNPDKGVKIWGNVLTTRYNDIENNAELKNFKNKVEEKLLSVYAAKAEKNLKRGKETGKTNEELEKIADTKVRLIITSHREEFITTVNQGVDRWTMPIVPPDVWPYYVSNASAIFGGAGSLVTALVTFSTGPILFSFGVGLLAIGLGAAIANAITTYGKEENAYKQSKVEKKVKDAIREKYNDIAEIIEAQEDLLVLLFTIEASKKGINLNKINTGKLKEFIWKELFTANFPEDRTAGAKKVEEEISKMFNKSLQREG